MSKSSTKVEMRGLRKAYPGVLALDNVDLDLFEGEVHALLGENGAGKSTLIKVLTGALERDAGDIRIDGKSVSFATTGDAQDAGISTVYQEVNLIPAMSVMQNLTLEKTYGRFGIINWRKARQDAKHKLDRLNLDLDLERAVSSYSVAIQQMVAIARALDDDTSVLVLDEPTASLDSDETAALFNVIRNLKANGIAVVFITHFLDQVYEISDRITVLRNGCKVGTGLAADIDRKELIAMMIGRELSEVEDSFRRRPPQNSGDIVLEAKGVGRKRVLAPFDLSLRTGEVVGLSGLLGSGRTELLKLIFGAISPDSGHVELRRGSAGISPKHSLHAGIALCPEDRKSEGLVGELSIRENIILSMQSKRGWLRQISRAEQGRIANEMIKAMSIATPDAEKPVRQLSGGNQQKVVLARALASTPRIMLLDEPTRGIDVGAHAEILTLIRQLCEDGLALLVASSEIDEVVSSSDRVAVMRDRQKLGELAGDDITRDKIVGMIVGDHG
ncbi:MAG: sugar ABC transporter ATP-binding protein [Rhodobacteraceae bacterium]|uniref:sugar ABC transporter ATP-binding protein n=1 Tax=Marivita sp. TaxID=2003365 RepID=UPI003B51AAA0|nr:sugar ABC transporter ATP-binding protein [Paracoccaceae bacterium]